jgi:hypothetical protein
MTLTDIVMTTTNTGMTTSDTGNTKNRDIWPEPQNSTGGAFLTVRRNIISLSLSEELADMMLEHWVDNGYASASEYIRELIRNDLRQNG